MARLPNEEASLSLSDFGSCRAAATAQATEDRYGVAQALLTEARFQHHCGTPDRALAALQQASEHFATLGATKDIQTAQSLLEQWQTAGEE